MPVYVKNPTWADGAGGATPITAAKLNVIEDGIFAAHYQPAVRVYHNTTQSITNSTLTALAFNSERYDTDANAASTMHDTVTNNSRLTCRTAGIYSIVGHVNWAVNPTNAEIHVRVNGTTTIASQNVAADYRYMNIATHYQLAVNDYVELLVKQFSSGSINVASTANESPEFMMAKVA